MKKEWRSDLSDEIYGDVLHYRIKLSVTPSEITEINRLPKLKAEVAREVAFDRLKYNLRQSPASTFILRHRNNNKIAYFVLAIPNYKLMLYKDFTTYYNAIVSYVRMIDVFNKLTKMNNGERMISYSIFAHEIPDAERPYDYLATAKAHWLRRDSKYYID